MTQTAIEIVYNLEHGDYTVFHGHHEGYDDGSVGTEWGPYPDEDAAKTQALRVAAEHEGDELHHLFRVRGGRGVRYDPRLPGSRGQPSTAPANWRAARFMNLPQAAQSLGVTAATLRQQVKNKRLAAVREETPRGPVWMVSAEEVERYRREHLGRRGQSLKHQP